MRLFDIAEAQHFCRPLPSSLRGVGQSLESLHSQFGNVTRLVEGSQNFTDHRVSLLNAIERWILFGIAGYRRALDMFIPSNAPWAHVTLYYSSFFAANAILGMFGVWIHFKSIVDVEQGTPKSQKLRIRRKFRSPLGYTGSHKVFWDFFYEGCISFSPWVPLRLKQVTTPVNSDRTWPVRARNDVNYDSFIAFQAAQNFSGSFDPTKLDSVTGPLRQQLELTEDMLRLALYFANYLGVSSLGLDGLGVTGQRSKIMRKLVTKVPPSLTKQSALQELLQ